MNMKISTNSQVNGALNKSKRDSTKSNERKLSRNKSLGLQESKKNCLKMRVKRAKEDKANIRMNEKKQQCQAENT